MNSLLLLTAAVPFAATSAMAASAAEVTLIAPGGIRAAIEQLIPEYERRSGNKVNATFGSGGGTKERVIKGEAFDVPVVQPPLDPVLASGHVIADTKTKLASVCVGVAVRQGAPKPDIATADAVKRLLLGAKAIAYPDAARGAAAGVSFLAAIDRLGLSAPLQGKLKASAGGAGAMAMLAKGEVDVGVTFVSEIITEPGVELVGPLPRDVSPATDLVAFVSAQSHEADAARALIAFLSSPDAAAVYKERGMQPGC
jgi:molybdate transport system substrate-binding protein